MKAAKSILYTMNNGLQIPALGLGTWKSKPNEVKEAVKYALLEGGYRHLDCAFVYENETEVGEALKEVFASSSLKRSDIFVTSKCWNTFHSRSRVMEAVKKTLADLQLDYVDLYLVHWPFAFKEGNELFPLDDKGMYVGADVHFTETWKGMEDVFDAGLAKSIGLSNFNSEQVKEILSMCRVKPVMNQVEVHAYFSQHPLVDFCKKNDILVTAYSPLGSMDRPFGKKDDPILLEDPVIKEIGAKYSKSPAQILVKSLLQRGLVVIPKSVNPTRILQNMDVFDFELAEEDMKKIASLNRGWRAVPVNEARQLAHFPFAIPF